MCTFVFLCVRTVYMECKHFSLCALCVQFPWIHEFRTNAGAHPPSAFKLVCSSTAEHVYILYRTACATGILNVKYRVRLSSRLTSFHWLKYISNENIILVHRNILIIRNYKSGTIFWILYKETHSQTHSWCGWSWLDVMNKTLSLTGEEAETRRVSHSRFSLKPLQRVHMSKDI